MTVQMESKPIEPNKNEKHAREIDNLKEQCDRCKQYNKQNKHGGCEIRHKLISKDSEVAWKNKHLFLINGKCKMYKAKMN